MKESEARVQYNDKPVLLANIGCVLESVKKNKKKMKEFFLNITVQTALTAFFSVKTQKHQNACMNVNAECCDAGGVHVFMF